VAFFVERALRGAGQEYAAAFVGFSSNMAAFARLLGKDG